MPDKKVNQQCVQDMKQHVTSMKSGRIHTGNFIIYCITQAGKRLVHPDGKGCKVQFDVLEIQFSYCRILIDIPIIVPDQEPIEY
jgi:hypothetical protein